MVRAIVTLCVRHFGAVTALSVFALVLGCWGALRSPLDVFPEFVPSQVDIQTEAPGFAPQQVEELVTKQVENAVNGAAGLATLRSDSEKRLPAALDKRDCSAEGGRDALAPANTTASPFMFTAAGAHRLFTA